MCGRYQRRSDKQKIVEAFHLGSVDALALEFAPDYNAAPQSLQPVIAWDKQFGARSLQMMFWRFLPPYVTDPKKFRLKNWRIVRVCRGDMIRRVKAQVRCFQVVVERVVAIPRWMICCHPWAVETGGNFATATGGRCNVLRRVIELLQNGIIDFNERL